MKISVHILLFLVFLVALPVSIVGQDYKKIHELQKKAATTDQPETRAKAFLAISREFEWTDADSALKYAQSAYLISEKRSIDKVRVSALVQKGRMLLAVNQLKEAIQVCERGIELADEEAMFNEEAIANGVIGITYAELGDYDRSARYNFRALELFEQIGNKKEVGVTLANIAADMLSQKNYKKALDYMYQALQIAEDIGDKPGLAQQYNNIASVYFSSYNDYRKALEFYRKAYQVNAGLGDRLQSGINLLNIGYCHFRMNEMDSSVAYFTRSRDLFREIKNPVRTANSEIALAKYYTKTGDYNQGMDYAKYALSAGLSHDSKELIAESSEILHDLCLERKDTSQAYRYALLHFRTIDSLQVLQSQKTLFRLEYQYNYEKQDKERRLRQQRTNFIVGFLIMGLVSVIIIIFLVYSRQKIKLKNTILEKMKMTDDLNFKNKELTINLIALMKKNEMLTDISNKLMDLQQEAKQEETRHALSRISNEIQKNADDKMIHEFSLRFKEVHQGFYEALLKRFPDLTQNELKLCAYLRLNMTTKDIAELTSQRLLTIEHARYRLRKKLGISNSEVNLVTFLSQI